MNDLIKRSTKVTTAAVRMMNLKPFEIIKKFFGRGSESVEHKLSAARYDRLNLLIYGGNTINADA